MAFVESKEMHDVRVAQPIVGIVKQGQPAVADQRTVPSLKEDELQAASENAMEPGILPVPQELALATSQTQNEQPASTLLSSKSGYDAPTDSLRMQASKDIPETSAIATPATPVAAGALAACKSSTKRLEHTSSVSDLKGKQAKIIAEPPDLAPSVSATTNTPPVASMTQLSTPAAIGSEISPIPGNAKEAATAGATAGTSTAPGGAEVPADGSKRLKHLPNVAVEAAKHAGHAYMEAGKQAQITLKDLLSLRYKEGPPVTLSVDQIATVVFFLLVALQLLLLPLFLPSTFRLLYSLLWGLLFGLGLSFVFFFNRRRKTEMNELLGTTLGLKGVQLVAAGIPAMFNMSDTEKMEWLNALVAVIWPYVDKAACAMIREVAAQKMADVLSSLPSVLTGTVKSLRFKHLTFGAAPVRVEGIRVSSESEGNDKKSLVLELSVKWCGDPNITLAIEVAGGQKLCPRVLDITFAATVRAVMKPLVPRLPGFVALMVTVPKPPLIKYRLDFGKALGGSVAPAIVTPVINNLIRGMLDRMLVWPNRLVVPILQESPADAAEVQKLMRRMRGMVRVCVMTGKQLRGLGMLEDAVVELTTDTEYYECTHPRAAVTREELAAVDGKADRLPNTELITWNHNSYLLVQEPENQRLRVEVFQVHIGNAKNSAITTTTSSSSGANRRSVGRALVKLRNVCNDRQQHAGEEGEEEGSSTQQPFPVQLGENDWGSPGGPGKGAGTITLKISYFPCEDFSQEQVLGAKMGILTVRLLAISGLTPGADNSVTAYASFNLSSRQKARMSSWKTARKIWTLAAHLDALKLRLQRLQLSYVRDQREGDTEAAAAKAASLRALQQEIDEASDATKSKSRAVTLDYSMETQALHAFYKVTERKVASGADDGVGIEAGGGGGEGGGEDESDGVAESENKLVIRVVQHGRVKRNAAEEIGVAEVPLSRIRRSCCYNPLSGKKEYGLYIQKWQDFDPVVLGSKPPPSEWGLPLIGSATGRVWVITRWVPCVEPVSQEDEGETGAAS